MSPGQFFDLPASDRMAMTALEELDRSTCSCGHPMDESTDPEAMTDYRAKVLVCHACKAVHKAGEKAPAGARVYVEKVWDHRTDTALVDDLDDF